MENQDCGLIEGLAIIKDEFPNDAAEYRQYFFNLLYNFFVKEFDLSQENIQYLLNVSASTLHNWIKNIVKPSKESMKRCAEKIDERILAFFSTDQEATSHPKLSYLQNYFANYNSNGFQFTKYIKKRFFQKKTFKDFMQYLILESYLDTKKNRDENSMLIERENAKLLTCQISNQLKEILGNNCLIKVEIDEDDIDGLISINFDNMNAKYRILLAFLYSNIHSKEKLDSIIEKFGNANRYKGDMRILFVRDYLQNDSKIIADTNNVYIERINDESLSGHIHCFYLSKNIDSDVLIAMNLYSNSVINHFEKYCDTISKNRVFAKYMKGLEIYDKELNVNNAYERLFNYGTFYKIKLLTQYESQFEKRILTELIGNKRKDDNESKVIFLGYTGLPLLLDIHMCFDKIIMLDNSQVFCEMFNYFKDNCLNNDDKNDKINKAISKTDCRKFYLFNSTITSINEDLFGKVDLIVVAGGYASFLKNLDRYLTLFNLWLKPSGKVMASFYNDNRFLRRSIRKNLKIALDFECHYSSNSATSNIMNDYEHEIYCKSRSVSDAKDIIEKYLFIENVYTYPFMSLFLENDEQELNEFMRRIDENNSFSEESGMEYGYFIDIIAKKEILKEKCLYKFNSNIVEEEIVHDYIYNRAEQFEQLRKLDTSNLVLYDGTNVLKTLLVTNEKKNELFVVVMGANKRLIQDGRNIVVFNDKTQLCNIYELNMFGIEAGNISPFIEIKSENDDIKIMYFYDSKLHDIVSDWFFIGTNDCEKTIRISKKHLLKELQNRGFSKKDIATTEFSLEH